MNGIKMSDCKFYIDEPARTVVCVIPSIIERDDERIFIKDMVRDFISDNFRFSDFDLSYSIEPKLEKEIDMPRSFIGKAVCAEEDKWDVEVGKLLAYSRARDKLYKSFFKRANSFVQALDRRLGDIITAFNDFGGKLEDKRENITQRLEEMMKEAEEKE